MAMEVLSAQHPVHTPASLPTARDPRRPLSAVGLQQQQPLSAPASQESISSSDSSTAYSLQNGSSNASQLTGITTLAGDDPTRARELEKLHFTGLQRRARTPDEDSLTSPVSVTSPVFTNGTKRTASGHVKNASSYSSTPYIACTPGRTRAESMSSTGSRVGELAASLKTRLGYAMTKVQHGWEHKSIGELERLTSKHTPNRHSMSHVDARPNTAIVYDRSQLDGAMSPPSKRRSGMLGAEASAGRQLQPAADIHSHQHSRSADLRSLPASNLDAFAMSPPRTPVSQFPRRPPTIRTDTQTAEAERDALQALTQLGSPHNSQYSRHHNASQGNSSQASPLRSEFAPMRRVSFARGESDSSAIETSSEEGRGMGKIRGR